MKNLTHLALLSASLLYLSSGASYAAASVELGQPSYGGNGCPAGSASASISPDGQSLSILFDKYLVEAGGENGRVARKSCNLSIPVKVPNGISVSLISADYRGFVDTPVGTEARLDTEYFFGGSRGPKFTHTFRGPQSAPFTKSHQLIAAANTWSACGQDVNLRVNSGTTVRSSGNSALVTIDSADFKAGMVYHLRYRSCSTGAPAAIPVSQPANNTNRNNGNGNNAQPINNNRHDAQSGGVRDYYYPANNNNGNGRYYAPVNPRRNNGWSNRNQPQPRWNNYR